MSVEKGNEADATGMVVGPSNPSAAMYGQSVMQGEPVIGQAVNMGQAMP